MAPSRAGGRPRIPWDASRRRKLVRLYLMTTLKITDIQRVLETGGFKPGTRNIQAQLSALLPDINTEWRTYRPRDLQQGVHRLAQLKRCRENQVSKYTQRNARRCDRANAETKLPIETLTQATSCHFYNPARHYEFELPGGVPSHLSLPELSGWYLHQSLNLGRRPFETEPHTDDRSSDKEVLNVEEQPNPGSPISNGDTASVTRTAHNQSRHKKGKGNAAKDTRPDRTILHPASTRLPEVSENSTLTRSNSKRSLTSRRAFRGDPA
ncbi:uncharacterized protein PAC_12610 [Phialocephala subalpina]|uniref:Clr5 domain-containing protein n=1 Tax=Phialocephala subalpina TaxID=576137 RepID=A0A1L7XCH5_9HELO|nr:uncharacterized protein PAC_12610 [Phialocephala subalpina]